MQRFMILGHEFRFDRNDFKGPVIASEDAFYFVINKYGLADICGPVSGALAAANEHFGKKAASASGYLRDLAELPAELTLHPDWPMEQSAGSVLVVPRSAIRDAQMPWFWLNNRIYISADGLEVSVVYNLFRRGRIQKFLREISSEIAS